MIHSLTDAFANFTRKDPGEESNTNISLHKVYRMSSDEVEYSPGLIDHFYGAMVIFIAWKTVNTMEVFFPSLVFEVT